MLEDGRVIMRKGVNVMCDTCGCGKPMPKNPPKKQEPKKGEPKKK